MSKTAFENLRIYQLAEEIAIENEIMLGSFKNEIRISKSLPATGGRGFRD